MEWPYLYIVKALELTVLLLLLGIQDSSLMICHTTSCGAIFKDLRWWWWCCCCCWSPRFSSVCCVIFFNKIWELLCCLFFQTFVVGEIGLSTIFSNNPKASGVRKVGMPVNLHQQMTNSLKSQVACCAMQSKAKQHGATAAVTHPSKCCSKELLNGRSW